MIGADETISAGEFRKLVEAKAVDRDLSNLTPEQLDRVDYMLAHYKPGDEVALWAKYFEDGTPYEENANVRPI